MAVAISNLKVLLVDDQDDVRAIIKKMLTDLGVAEIVEAHNGREALSLIEDADINSIDLIVCDWNMPEMNGVSLLRKVREMDPDIPFLMVTGRGDMESVVEARSSGVTGYIRKPFSATQLEAKLRIILQKMAA